MGKLINVVKMEKKNAGVAILEWNKLQSEIEEYREKMCEASALDIQYLKRKQLGDNDAEALWWVTYNKTKILWEYRRDYLNAEI
jgi:hypothetical protein